MTPTDTLKKMSMSDLISRYNEVAATIGKEAVTEFKSLSFARSEVTRIETLMEQGNTQNVAAEGAAVLGEGATATTGEAGAATTGSTVVKAADSKYDSRDKRGPNQGVGAFAKEQLLLGKSNADVLAAVTEKYPTAKTSKGCIAFYRTALQRDGKLGKNGQAIPADPEAMRQAAAKLIEQAEKMKADAAEAQAKLEAAAAEKAAADAEAAKTAEAQPA